MANRDRAERRSAVARYVGERLTHHPVRSVHGVGGQLGQAFGRAQHHADGASLAGVGQQDLKSGEQPQILKDRWLQAIDDPTYLTDRVGYLVDDLVEGVVAGRSSKGSQLESCGSEHGGHAVVQVAPNPAAFLSVRRL